MGNGFVPVARPIIPSMTPVPPDVGPGTVKATGSTTARTLAARFADVVNVKDYGAKGDGVTDDTAALVASAAALPAAGGTLLLPPGSYLVSDEVTIAKAYTRVMGYGATITQTGSQKRGFIVSGAPGVVIEGATITNTHGAAEWGAGQFSAWGVDVIASPGTKIRDCTIAGWGGGAVRVDAASSDAEVAHNTLSGIGAAGGLVAGSNNNFGVYGTGSGVGSSGGLRIVDNVINGVAQGVFTYPNWTGTIIARNRFDLGGVGQACVYVDSTSNIQILDNECKNAGNGAIKVQMVYNGGSGSSADASNIKIAGNIIDTCGQAGITVAPADTDTTYRFEGVQITGNAIKNVNSAYDAVRVDSADDYLIAHNVIDAAGRGIRVGAVQNNSHDGRVSGNIIAKCQLEALSLQAASGYAGVVDDNLIIEPGLGGSTAAVYLSTGSWVYRLNRTVSAATPYTYNVQSHTSSVVQKYLNDEPGGKTDQLAGTVTPWNVSAGTATFTGLTVNGAASTTGNISGPRALITGASGVTANVYIGPYSGSSDVVYRNASSSYGHAFESGNSNVLARITEGGGIQAGQLNSAGIAASPVRYSGTGAPNNTYGSDGDFYDRKDGTAAGKTLLYHKESGSWVPAVP